MEFQFLLENPHIYNFLAATKVSFFFAISKIVFYRLKILDIVWATGTSKWDNVIGIAWIWSIAESN